jgi:trk system potassium uptake protein TrkA
MMMFVVVIGGGGAGHYLAERLTQVGHKVTVIDTNPDVLKELSSKMPSVSTIVGDGSKLETLRKAGLEKADILAILTGVDARNVAIAMLAKNEFRIPRVVTRVNDPKHEWLFDRQTGIDHAFNQDALLVEAIMKAIQTT